jgi:hypothetical protein
MPTSRKKQKGIVQDERGQEQPASKENARRGSATTRDKLANMGGDGLTDPDSDEDVSERLRQTRTELRANQNAGAASPRRTKGTRFDGTSYPLQCLAASYKQSRYYVGQSELSIRKSGDETAYPKSLRCCQRPRFHHAPAHRIVVLVSPIHCSASTPPWGSVLESCPTFIGL